MAGRRPSRAEAGSLGAVIEEWKSSPDWKRLAQSSRDRYSRLLNHVQSLAFLDVQALRRRHVLKLRDQFAAQAPATASGLVSLMSILLNFALDREYVDANVAFKVARPKVGRHGRWSNEDIEFFLANAKEPIRRAGLLAMETGQRRGDLLALPWTKFDGRTITILQQKTGELVQVAASARLAAELVEWRRGTNAVTILVNGRFGRPWTYAGFSASWDAEIKRLRALSIAQDRAIPFDPGTFHGLRATHACWLLEAGASTNEVMSVCGWRSVKQFEHYTRDVGRKRQASAAIVKLDHFRTPPPAAKETA